MYVLAIIVHTLTPEGSYHDLGFKKEYQDFGFKAFYLLCSGIKYIFRIIQYGNHDSNPFSHVSTTHEILTFYTMLLYVLLLV